MLGLVVGFAAGCPEDGTIAGTDTDIDEMPVCGNGVIDAGEACDASVIPVNCIELGFSGGALSCDETCQIVATACTGCGDGSLDPGEGCDDANNDPGDGCGPTCEPEIGWSCAGSPSTCMPSCGDGVLDPTEGCDDADLFSGDGCSAACTIEPGFTCAGQPSVCASQCGNGAVEPGEQCDTNNFGGQTCELLGFLGGDLLCAGNCTINTAGCDACGDGNADVGEECDGLDLGFSDCTDLGFGDGILACAADCTYDTTACDPCGNGIIDEKEECDDGFLNSDVIPDACRLDCTAPICGDGVADTGEECDDRDANSNSEADACRSDCTAASCGDSVVDTGEMCDPPDGGATCDEGCTVPVGCANCGDLLAGSDAPGCCGSSDLATGLELCVCGGLGSDCAIACADTLCMGADPAGDDCEVCLEGKVDCTLQFANCIGDATAQLGPETTPEACGDACNNDVDETTDCDDADCFGVGVCADAELNCTDGEDNDDDGMPDCMDVDCAKDPACEV